MWPDLESQTKDEKANNLAKQSQALMQFVTGNVQQVITPVDFFVYMMGLKQDDAEAIVKRAQELAKQTQTQQPAVSLGTPKIPDNSTAHNLPPPQGT